MRREREDEVTGGAELRRERIQSAGVGPQLLQLLRAAHTDHEARAARADDAQRAAIIEVVGGERERIEYGEALAIIEDATDRRVCLAHGDAPLIATAAHLDIDNAGL